jgi:AraC family transcriptional regulator, melibiose operon regulatory protein
MAEIITDGSQKELKKHGSDEFPLLVSYEKLSGYKSGSFLWHWHPEIEITLVLDGQILYKVNQCTYHMKAGDILLGNANVLHAGFMEDMKDGKYVSITFLPKIIYGSYGSILRRKYVEPFLHNFSIPAVYIDYSQPWHEIFSEYVYESLGAALSATLLN